jgi:D-proline reductase (dithiol) PrdB
VLARAIEAAGISTALLTMMPLLAEASGTPRIVGIEFPFAHPLGHAHDRDEQLAVIRATLRALPEVDRPNTVVDLPFEWPDFDQWKKSWQPPEPAPIVALLREQARRDAEARRAQEKA